MRIIDSVMRIIFFWLSVWEKRCADSVRITSGWSAREYM